MSDTAKAGADKAPEGQKQDTKGGDAGRVDASKDTAKAGADKAPDPKRDAYHVVGPGSVTLRGKAFPARARVDLTEDEAKSLGDNVKLGRPPKLESEDDIAGRKGGKYVVAGPGTVWHDGKPREKGFALQLDETEARKLGVAVAPAE